MICDPAPVGGLRLALTAAGIPWQLATPQKWKRGVDGWLIAPKAASTEKKRRAREVAARMFPHLRVTNATADALLIAEYARLIREEASC